MIRRLAAWCLGLGLAASCVGPGLAGVRAAAGDGDFAKVMQLLAEHRHRRARFTERQYLAVLDRPLQSAGELIYDAPDRLEERLLRPRRQSFVVDGDVLVVARAGRRRTLDLRRFPEVAAVIGSIRATLAGDAAALSRTFVVEFDGDLAHWTLRLAPRSAELARRIERIRIDGARDALLRVDIRQAGGDRSAMTIEDTDR